MTTSQARLPKPARREQLLDTAVAVVRDHGADGLTLVTLAEMAGVSRPVVYNHFGTRPGLLLALYRRLDERYRNAIVQAVRDAESNPGAVARVISAAYFSCAADMPELDAISAAVKGSPEGAAVQRDLIGEYVGLMTRALSPYSDRAPDGLRLHCLGVLGAAEAIAAELNAGHATTHAAVTTLSQVILGGLCVR